LPVHKDVKIQITPSEVEKNKADRVGYFSRVLPQSALLSARQMQTYNFWIFYPLDNNNPLTAYQNILIIRDCKV